MIKLFVDYDFGYVHEAVALEALFQETRKYDRRISNRRRFYEAVEVFANLRRGVQDIIVAMCQGSAGIITKI